MDDLSSVISMSDITDVSLFGEDQETVKSKELGKWVSF